MMPERFDIGAQGQELSCLCGMLATEADLLDSAVKTAVNGFFAKLQAWVVDRAEARGVAAPGGLPPAAFARLLVSLLEGALLLSRLQAHKAWVPRGNGSARRPSAFSLPTNLSSDR